MKLYHGREDEFSPHLGQFWATTVDRSSYYAGPDGFITEADFDDDVRIRNVGHGYGHRAVDMHGLLADAKRDGIDFLLFPETTNGEDASTYVLVNPDAVHMERVTTMPNTIHDADPFPAKGSNEDRLLGISNEIESGRFVDDSKGDPIVRGGEAVVQAIANAPQAISRFTVEGLDDGYN